MNARFSAILLCLAAGVAQAEGSDWQPSLGGQYRINAYSADNDDGNGRQAAARARIRQNLDMAPLPGLSTHLQLELGHTVENITTTAASGQYLGVRHAVIEFRADDRTGFQAGVVPLGDRMGDVLFSSDWDYNPLALSLFAPLAGGELRVFAATLMEGSEQDSTDDFTHYQLDFTGPIGGRHELDLDLSLVTTRGGDEDIHVHANAGLSLQLHFSEDLALRSTLLGSYTEKELLDTDADGDGLAALLSLETGFGLSLLGTWASGREDASGFLPLMALPGANGYWGYTGILTVQGPTDTGFDGDAVNISNNGHGMASTQVRLLRPVVGNLSIHLAGGWFGGTRVSGSRDELVGIDLLAMGSFHFNSFLALDSGVAYARLGDSVSGYSAGMSGISTFNQGSGERRDKCAVFSRLQAEF